jgi:DNA mismatch repair protein MutL
MLASDAVDVAPARASFQAPQPMLVEWVKNPPPVEEPAKESAAPGAADCAPDFRVLGMRHHRFVVLESEDGLVLFDPKAAKERIFYEKLLRHHGDDIVETQGLLVPVLLELDPRDLDLVLRERMALGEAGLDVEAFGGNTLQIRSLPACLPVEDPREFLGALMDELLHDSSPGARFAIDRLARILSKRASAQIIPKLAETRPLLAELFACELPYCAADGRPTLTELGMRELDRRFGGAKG